MAIGDLITATRYNNLQNRINTIMGVGSGDSGYGQALASSTVAIGSSVDLTRVLNLRTDMIKARQHQTGANEGPSPGTGAFPLVTTASQVTDAFAANLESQMTTIENNKFTVATSQISLESGTSSVRTASWNTQLLHEITVDFGSANTARHFFNAGGLLRIRATLSGGTSDTGPNQIFTDWLNLLTNAGTVIFNHTNTTNTGTSGTGSTIGFYDLTTANQQIFTKTGSGNYAANDWTVYARKDVTGRYVFLRIEFNDDKVENPNFDEAVTGTLTSIVEMSRPTGANVSVTAPTFVTTLGVDNAPGVPTYSVTANFGAVEGFTARWTINTTNVPTGTVLYWQITGDSNSADWVGGNTGTVTITSNSTILNVSTVEDNIKEDTENNSLTLRTGSQSGPIVAVSGTIPILNKQPLGTYWVQYDPPYQDPGETPSGFTGDKPTGPVIRYQFAKSPNGIAFIPNRVVPDTSGIYEGNCYAVRRYNQVSYASNLPSDWWVTSTPTFTRDTSSRYFKSADSLPSNTLNNELTTWAGSVTTWGQQYNNIGGYASDSREEVFCHLYTITYAILPASKMFATSGTGNEWEPLGPPKNPSGYPSVIQFISNFSRHGKVVTPTGTSSGNWGAVGNASGAGAPLRHTSNANSSSATWTQVFDAFGGGFTTTRNTAVIRNNSPFGSFDTRYLVVHSFRYIWVNYGSGDFSATNDWYFVDLGETFTGGAAVTYLDEFTKVWIIVTNQGKIWRSQGNIPVDWEQMSSPTTEPLNDIICHRRFGFLAVGNNGTVIISEDQGLTWTLQSGIPPTVDLTNVVCDTEGKIAIATGYDENNFNVVWYVSVKEN